MSAQDYYAFGMQMPGRTYNIGDYRYGFNGKENDNEVKGNGNSIDFGSRIYDPRLGRWLSVDPQFDKLPDLSPYNYVANNPLRFIDPNGEFLLDVHQRIAHNALKGFSIRFDDSHPLYRTSKNFINNSGFISGLVGLGTAASGGITYPDRYKHTRADHTAHFDAMDFKQIVANVQKVKQSSSSAASKFKSGEIDATTLGHEVGKSLHAIQDLYSHSNYIELYTETFGKAKDLSSIPTLNQALTDKKYAKFASVLKDKLKTGKYPGEGEGYHKTMNKDVGAGSEFTAVVGETRGKEVTYESRAAEAVATKASKEHLNEVKNQVER